MSLNGDLAGVVEELKRLHWAAETRMSEAQALYEQTKTERDHIVRMLKAAGAYSEEPKPEPKPKRARVNAETREAVMVAVNQRYAQNASTLPDVRGSFTVTDLEKEVAVHQSSIRTAVAMLREEGVLRAIGKVPNSPRQAPMAYALNVVAVEPGQELTVEPLRVE